MATNDTTGTTPETTAAPTGGSSGVGGTMTVLEAVGGEPVMLPEGVPLALAEFGREGGNLVMEFPDGSTVTVRGYFDSENPPDLKTPGGVTIVGDLAERLAGPEAPGQVAQAGTAASAEPIGQVEKISGTVTATRADGTKVELQEGDAVFQGDILETSADGGIGVILADETTFSMAESGRMVLDEMVYDPGTQEGSVNFSVVQGVFTFVSGQVAKTDPDAMQINTPVATIGIRGTQVGIEIPDGENMNVVLMEEADGFVGEVVILNSAGSVVMNMANDFTSLSSFDVPPAPVITIGEDDMVDRFVNTLMHLPTDRSESANDFGLQSVADFETAAGGEGEAGAEGGADTLEGLSDFDAAEDEDNAADLADFDVAAGQPEEEPAPEEDIDVTLEDYDPNAGQDDGGDDNAFNLDDVTPETPTAATPPQDETPTTVTTAVNADPTAAAATGTVDEDTLSVTIDLADKIGDVEDADGALSIAVDTGESGWTASVSGTVVTLTATAGSYDGLAAGDSLDVTGITYTVTDSDGASSDAASIGVTVTGTNDAPVASNVSVTGTEDTDVTGQLTATDVDTAQADLTFSLAENGGPANGTVTVNADGSYTYTPNADYNGADSFTYQVDDGQGGTDTATVTLNLEEVNDAPEAGLVLLRTTEDTPVEITSAQLLAGASDAEGDSLSVVNLTVDNGTLEQTSDGTWLFTPDADASGDPFATLSYGISDGVNVTSTTASMSVDPYNDAPVAGDVAFTMNEDSTISISPAQLLSGASDVDADPLVIVNPSVDGGDLSFDATTGTWTFTPNENFNGEINLSYGINDGTVTTDTTATITVEAVNDGPVATDDTAAVAEDGSVVITAQSLLSNDSDVDGDTLTITNVSDPVNGTVSLDGNGDVVFTPDADFNGEATFTYTVDDGQGGTDTATVTVDVSAVADSAVIGGDTTGTVDEDTVVSASGELTVSDADGAAEESFQAGTATGDYGTFAVDANGDWTYTLNNDSAAVQALDDGSSETETFTVLTADGTSQNVTVTVTGTNDVPVVSDATSFSVAEDGSVTISESALLANASDADLGDFLTVTNLAADGGTLTDNNDGTWTFEPAADFSGTVNLTYGVTDGTATTPATGTIAVSEVNDAPTAVAAADITGEDSLTVTIDLADKIGDVEDADSALSIAVDTGESGWTASVSGTVVTLTATAGSYDSLAAGDSLDVTGITYTVTDSDGASSDAASIGVTVTGTNDAPVASNVSVTGTEDTDVTGQLTATDVDTAQADLTFSLAENGGPANGTVTVNADGSYTYTPNADYNGADSFTYQVDDGQGGTDTATVSINLSAEADAAVIGGDTTGTVDEDTVVSASGELTVSDADGAAEESFQAGTATGDYGTFAVDANGDWTYTLNNDSAAVQALDDGSSETETFTVLTADGTSQNVTVTVTGTNDVPVVSDATSFSVAEDGSVTISESALLANASDVDAGDNLSVTNLAADGGTLTDNNDGTWTFEPAADFSGTVNLTYGVTDGTATTPATGTIAVSEVNDAPTAAAAADSTGEDSLTVTIDLADKIGDVEDADSALSIAVDTGESGWTASVSGTVVTLTATAGSYDGLAAGDSLDVTGITYTVTDSDGASSDAASIGVTVTGTNDAPVASNVSVTGTEDTDVTGQLTATDVDTAQADLTFSLAENGGPANGTVTVNADGSYTYTPNADYNGADSFTYQVDDGQGGTDTATVSINLSAEADAAVIGGDTTGTVDEDTVVSASGELTVSDADGAAEESFQAGTATGDYGTFAVDANGDWTYTLNNDSAAVQALDDGSSETETFTVLTADGTSQNVTVTVTGTNDAPVVSDATSFSVAEDGSVTISESALLANASDADLGDFLTVTNLAADGGTLTDNNDGTWTFEPAADFSGTVNLTYGVTDGTATTPATGTIAVSEVNDAPTAAAAADSTGEDSLTVTIDLADKIGDVEDADSALSIAVDTGESGWTASVSGTVVTLTATAGSYDSLAAGDSLDVTGITYTVTDSDGASSDAASIGVTVTGTNDAPVASNVSVTGTEDTDVTGQLTATDVDTAQADLTFSLAENGGPANGTVTVNADGSYTYTPNADYNGADSFTYQVDDGQGGTDTATVSINLSAEADAAVIGGDTTGTVDEDTVVSASGELTVSDADGAAEESFQAGTATGDYGTFAVDANGDWTYTLNNDSAAVQALDDGSSETETFTVLTADGTSQNVTVTVTGTNDVPVVSDATSFSVAEDGSVTISESALLANASDVDAGDNLSVTNLAADGGTLTDNNDGTWTFEPAADFSGTVNLTYGVTDGTATTPATGTIAVSEVNDAPTAAAAADSTGEDSLTVTIDLADKIGDVEDADSALSIAVDTGESGWTASVSGTVVTLTATAGSYDSLAAGDSLDVTGITYTVTDSDGASSDAASIGVTVTGTNDAPVASNVSVTGTEDTDVTGQLTATDVDTAQADLTFSLAENGGPANGTVTVNADGSYTYTPNADYNGADSFTYQVDDGQGGTDTATVSINLSAEADAAVIGGDTTGAVTEDTALSSSGTLTVSDADGADQEVFTVASTEGSYGTFEIAADGEWTYTLNNDSADVQGLGAGESMTETFTVTSADGTAQVVSVVVNGTNDGPVPGDVTLAGTAEDTSVVITANQLLAGATDADGDSLTVSDVSVPVEQGTIEANPDGGWIFTPAADFNGDVTISYNISDGIETVSTSAGMTVTAVNDGPVAESATGVAGEDSLTVTIDLADQISDVEDADSALSIAVDTGESGWTASVNGTVVTLTATEGSYDELAAGDSLDVTGITYTVTDSDGATSDAASIGVTVTGSNDGPVANDSSQTTNEDMAVSGQLTATDVDTADENLTFSLATDGGPAHGTIEIDTDGSYVYTPDANYSGSDSFTYEVDDGQGGTTMATVNLAVTPDADAPTLSVSIGAGEQDNAGTSTLSIENHSGSAGFENSYGYYTMDADGNPVSGQIIWADVKANNGDTVTLEDMDPDTTGFFLLSDGGTQNPGLTNDTEVTFEQDDDGNWQVLADGQVLEASSRGGLFFSDASLNPDGTAYMADTATIGDQNWEDLTDGDDDYNDFNATTEWTGGSASTTTHAVTIDANLTDTDGSETLAVVVDGLPDGATLSAGTENADGSWSVPTSDLEGLTMTVPSDSSDFALTVTATSTETVGGDTASTSVTATVEGVNIGPDVSDVTVTTDEDVSITITEAQLLEGASDLNGDDLSVTDVSADTGTLVDNGDGTWTFTPDENSDVDVNLSFTVSDGEATTDASVNVIVNAVADAPTVTTTVTHTATEGVATEVAVSQAVMDAANPDGADPLTVLVSNVPDGASLTVGTDNGDGTWTLSGDQLPNLMVSPTDGGTNDIALNISVFDGDPSPDAVTLIDANFNSGTDGFTYSDGVFGTDNAYYERGERDDDALEVTLGGRDRDDITDGMSGGHSVTFDVPEDGTGTLTFSYRVKADNAFENDEYTEVRVEVDGTAFGTSGNDYVYHDAGGGDSGWQTVTVDLSTLSAGEHSLTLGGYLNKKTSSNEDVEIKFDNVQLSVTESVPVLASESVTVSPDVGEVFSLDISAALTDLDGSEELTVMVGNLPEGGALSAGTPLGDGSWSLTADDLDGLTMSVPEGTADFSLAVSATSTEKTGDSETTMTSIPVDVPEPGTTDDGGTGDTGDTTDNTNSGIGNGAEGGTDETNDADPGNSADNNAAGDNTADNTSGSDAIVGTSGNDYLEGTDGDDAIIGTGGDDMLYGGKGDDVLIGGDGDDVIIGGRGDDIAIFEGEFDDYEVSFDHHGNMTVEEKDTGEVDTLLGVEKVEFSDATFDVVGGRRGRSLEESDTAEHHDLDTGESYSTSSTDDGSTPVDDSGL